MSTAPVETKAMVTTAALGADAMESLLLQGDLAKLRPGAAVGACSDELKKFIRAFPGGATWPDDIEKARATGLNVDWAWQRLGLVEPK